MTGQSQQAFMLERKESFFGNYTQRSNETKGNIASHKTKENLKIKGNMTIPKPCHPVKKQYFACSDRIECTSTRNIITTPTHWKNKQTTKNSYKNKIENDNPNNSSNENSTPFPKFFKTKGNCNVTLKG